MMPEDAIILPDKETSYIAVWQTETKLVLRLLNLGEADEFDIKLDKKILPDLVDALIKIQNNEP